jgi:hypothetical protein
MILKQHPHTTKIKRFSLGGLDYYVHRTNVRTWVVATCYPYTLDDLVPFQGAYHFDTLKALRSAVDTATTTTED